MNTDVPPKPQPNSFAELKRDNSLRYEVKTANWKYMRTILGIEKRLRQTNATLHHLLQEIGQTVVDDDSPHPASVATARKLKNELRRLELQSLQAKEQMYSAMREKLAGMLPFAALEKISEEQFAAFFGELEKETHTQLWFGSMMKNGRERIKDSMENDED